MNAESEKEERKKQRVRRKKDGKKTWSEREVTSALERKEGRRKESRE